VVNFAKLLEKVCVDCVEAGHMTKDLAILIGKEQKWETTNQFLDTLDAELKRRAAK
jgi:isocitrate dehydrogenase